jgi:hypothetical protein
LLVTNRGRLGLLRFIGPGYYCCCSWRRRRWWAARGTLRRAAHVLANEFV